MKKKLKQAVTLYESFREKKPRKLATIEVDIPEMVVCMGHVEFIGYRTTHGKKLTLYRHDFAAGSRPLLNVSADGRQLLLIGGRYKWTERGIVDRDAQDREIENAAHGETITDPWDERTPSVLRRQANSRNHLGEKEYQTWAGWKRAAKAAGATWFDGDQDIAQAMIGPKPYKEGATRAVGEWDGAVGIIFIK